jgi:GAF domain-containing protein
VSVDKHALAGSLSQFAADLDDVPAVPLATRLASVVDDARRILDVESVGLLLLDDADRLRTVATTGPASAALEKAHERTGVGPGSDVLNTGRPLPVSDLGNHPGYEELWRMLAGAGVRAVLALPVRVGGEVVGNLNVVRPDAHAWSEQEVAAAGAFADIVGTLLELTAQGTPHTALDLPAPGPAADDDDPDPGAHGAGTGDEPGTP